MIQSKAMQSQFSHFENVQAIQLFLSFWNSDSSNLYSINIWFLTARKVVDRYVLKGNSRSFIRLSLTFNS